MYVKLVTKTMGIGEFEGKTIDEIIVGQARVSTKKEGDKLFEKPEILLRHLLLNSHLSPFDLANIGFEIQTSRAMGRELLRHWSIHPNEWSQRYSETLNLEGIELRIQSEDNRQSSTNPMNSKFLNDMIEDTLSDSLSSYKTLLDNGTARETARFVLPECATTKLFMNGTVRSWLTFLNVRLHKTAQKEIRIIAELVRDELIKQCPVICKSLYDFDNSYNIHIMDRLVLEKFGVYDAVKWKELNP
jgi:thymidylate synthase (FAD)